MAHEPDLTKFAFEIEGASGGFILGRSHIGDAITADTVTWLAYTGQVTKVDFTRDASTGPLRSTPSVGTMNVTLYDKADSRDYANDFNLRTNVAVRLTYNGQPLFTGWVRDVDLDPSPKGGTFVTIQAVDAVGVAANTIRYGAASLDGVEPYTARVARVTENANIQMDLPAPPPTITLAPEATGWSAFGLPATGVASATLFLLPIAAQDVNGLYVYGRYTSIELDSVGGAGTWTIPAYTLGAQRTVTGLTVGKTYRLAGSFLMALAQSAPRSVAVGVVGKGWGTPHALPMNAPDERELEYVFTATATSHTIRVTWAETWTGPRGGDTFWQAINWRNLVVEEYRPSNAYRLRNIARETSVANHLTIASNSVGAHWWPTRQGPVKARDLLDATVRLDLTAPAPVRTGQRVALNRSTRDVVNAWDITNLGRDELTGNTADESTTLDDDESIATYGARSATIETSLDVRGWRADAVERRGADLLAWSATTQLGVNAITARATDDPDAYAVLDLNDLVQVPAADGTPFRRRINRITHRITSRSWQLDLGLRKE
ncbi:MAG: hypothetical protein P1U38_09870 [Aeromicrobium sp.]|uniref:hypothetical protein n=1 Tax=Aeromicrobium sp. TaxID=1871063 RepID=UPI00261FCF45|nr:hypothetical protein [Aeromicrobium sp.]MDF1705069.1 hypothetical protein [Aeromicrobium sp.]